MRRLLQSTPVRVIIVFLAFLLLPVTAKFIFSGLKPHCELGSGFAGCVPHCTLEVRRQVEANFPFGGICYYDPPTVIQKLGFLLRWVTLAVVVLAGLILLKTSLGKTHPQYPLRRRIVMAVASFFGIVFYPLALSIYTIRGSGSRLSKIITVFLAWAVLLPLWALGTLIIVSQGWTVSEGIGQQLGLVQEKIYIAGTGSMYPTFAKGEGDDVVELSQQTVAWPLMRRYPGGIPLFGKRYFGYQLVRGDIVSFSNAKTKEIATAQTGVPAGFVKRIIALAGDRVEIRDGFVWLNGSRLDEPYTASARSTFGGDFLPDCQILTVSPGQALVLGDNRKGSGDSRHELGLINIADIDHVLPLANQEQFKSVWRDTSHDADRAGRPTLDAKKYVDLLNQKRRENGVPPLKYHAKLEQSALKRADVIIKTDDFSYEATRSGYTMDKALSEVGYSNITWGEAPTQGYYEAEELVENYFQFPDTKKFLLEKDFQETGVGVEIGSINGCPVQVVVQHLAGYVPPDYKQEDIAGWKKALSQLREIQPGWESLKTYPEFYSQNQKDVDRINSVIATRVIRIDSIVRRMEANLWLTNEQQQWADEDNALADEQNKLAQKLNSL